MIKFPNQSLISSPQTEKGIMTNEEYYSVFDQMIEGLQTDNRRKIDESYKFNNTSCANRAGERPYRPVIMSETRNAQDTLML